MQLRNVLAAATAAVVFSSGVANAALVLDLRIAGGGGKTATVAAIGDVLTLELFGVLPNLNAGADSISVANSGARSTGTTLGNYTSAIAAPAFSGIGHQDTDGPTVIVPGDRDGDGDLDIGGALTTSALNWFGARAIPSPQPGTNQLLGTFIWQVTTLGAANSTTNLNSFVRAATAGYTFVDDGVVKNGIAGNVVLGTPIVVTVVPEPATLGLAASAAAMLLARRRRQA